MLEIFGKCDFLSLSCAARIYVKLKSFGIMHAQPPAQHTYIGCFFFLRLSRGASGIRFSAVIGKTKN